MDRILIFDFDGTIVDSKKAYYHAIEKLLGKLGLEKKLADKTIDKGLSLMGTFKSMGFSRIKSWFLKRKVMKEVLQKVNEVKKCRDVESIRKLKCKKILVSNSLSEFIFPVLRHLRIEDEFDEIYGADVFEDKETFIQNYIKRNSINKKECYYIGDRVKDVIIARNLGIKSIIISNKCSWNSRKEILKEKPDFVLFDLIDIKEVMD